MAQILLFIFLNMNIYTEYILDLCKIYSVKKCVLQIL